MPLPPRIGRYTILELLGQGAMGVVYRGRDEALERDVAVKVVRGESLDDASRAQFHKEARAAARLQHPHIVTVYELGEEGDVPFMAMELLEGHDLQHAMREGTLADPARALTIVEQVLAGLGHAHARGIVHRDMKPSNVYLLGGSHAKILDFGVARLGEGLTVTGRVVGTPHYMSPEQIRADPVDGRSDLFSTSLMFYEMVTGTKAYRPGSAVTVMYQIVHEDADLTRLPRTRQGAELLRVLRRALARDRNDRYPDAAALAAALAAAVRANEQPPPLAASTPEVLTHVAGPAADLDLGGARTIEPPLGDADLSIRSSPALPVGPEGPAGAAAPSRAVIVTAALVLVLTVAAGAWWWWVSRPEAAIPASVIPMPAAEASLPATAPTSAPSAGPSTPPTAVAPETVPAVPTPPTTLASRPVLPPSAPSPATPRPSSPTGRVPADPRTRLDRADELFQSGHLGAALNEARAVLREHPDNAEAKYLVEDIELDLTVEQHLKKARTALARGDRETARREAEEGLRLKPNESRLTALLRELGC